MNRREAALILGVGYEYKNSIFFKNIDCFSSRPTPSKTRLRDAYKRLIILNHPDRGRTFFSSIFNSFAFSS